MSILLFHHRPSDAEAVGDVDASENRKLSTGRDFDYYGHREGTRQAVENVVTPTHQPAEDALNHGSLGYE